MSNLLTIVLIAGVVGCAIAAYLQWNRPQGVAKFTRGEAIKTVKAVKAEDIVTKYGVKLGDKLPPALAEAFDGDEKLVERLKNSDTGITPRHWMGMRLLSLVTLASIGAMIALAIKPGPLIMVGIFAGAGLLGWMLPDARIKKQLKARKAATAQGLPGFLQSIRLGLRAGETITTAFYSSVEATPAGLFRDELDRMAGQARAGAGLAELFQGLARRTGDPQAKQLASTIRLGQSTGADIEPILGENAEAAQKRKVEAVDAKIQKLPGMLLILSMMGLPLAGFVFIYPMISDIMGAL